MTMRFSHGGGWRLRASLALACGALAAPAAAQPSLFSPQPISSQPNPAAPAVPKPDPAFEAAKRAFEGLAEAERQRIQDWLVWTGDLNGSADGTFGRRTYEAILAYQRRAKAEPSGLLDERARTGLAQAARRAQDTAGFKVVTDAATGIVLGIPERSLPKRDTNPRGGSRWQSADGKITLDTRSIPAGETDLPALYERNLAIQTPGRQVTYKVLRPDFFVIAGETPTGKFYMRYATAPAGIRGFSIGYDKAVAADFDRSIVAISNSFVPFPDPMRAAAAAAAAAAAQSVAPRPPAAVPVPPRPPAPEPARPVLVGTGLVIAPGQAATSAAIGNCAEPRVAGLKARIAGSDASGLRLLAFEGGPKPVALSLAGTPAAADVVVVAIGTSFGAAGPVAAAGTMSADGHVNAPLQVGGAGAPVFDRNGALLGLIASAPAAKRQVAGLVPPTAYGIVPAGEIARAAGRDLPVAAAPAGERSAAEVMAALRGAVVPIECML